MARLAAFWQAFLDQLKPAWDLPDTLKKLGGLAVIVLGVLGYSTAWTDYMDWFRPLSFWLQFPLIALLAWLIAVAWERSKGPIIWLGKVGVDEGYRFFEFPVKNRGAGEVIAYVYATALHDRHGTRIPRIDTKIELHCRGHIAGHKVKLFGSEQAHAAALQVNKGNDPNTAHLLLPTPGEQPGEYRVVPLVQDRPTPLKDQHKLYLFIRVDFFSDEGKFLKHKERRLAITPDESSPLYYRVRPAWPWE